MAKMIKYKQFKQMLSEAKNPDDKIVAQLETLSKNISKYAHRWNDSPSSRMYKWVDTYNDLKEKHRHGAWVTYCKKHGFSLGHDAYDNLA
jgi:hypothetical protein